jgi:hypothetical protein
MTESIIVGLVVGVGVAVVGAYIGHHLRQKEMKAQWEENERGRKSERKRELLERELAVITEFGDVNSDLWSSIIWWAPTGKLLSVEARAEMGNEAFMMHARANIAALSIGDKSLNAGVKKLVELMQACNALLDPGTSKPYAGEDEKYQEAVLEMRRTTANIRRRGRELLEEA